MKQLIKYLCILGMITHVTADDIYQYTDKKGNLVYTNKATKNAKKVNLPPISIYSSPMTKNDYGATGYTNKPSQTNSKNPTIYTKTTAQNSGTNETGRQQILAEELSKEKQALSDTQQALATAKQTKLASEKNNPELYQTRIQSLQDAVTEHTKNISILSNQLGVSN